MIDDFISKHRLDSGFSTIAQQWYIPLAEKINAHHKSAGKAFFVGINGCQGSGKSTLSDFLLDYLTHTYQLNVVVLSLDDFYLSHAKRTELAKTCHPLLQTRGVPGTHDMVKAKEVIQALTSQASSQPSSKASPKVCSSVKIPRFNKATDDPYPEAQWSLINTPVDVVIFEGWCWGVNAQSNAELAPAINTLELTQDKNEFWRNYVNQKLQSDYQPLYAMMDYWIMLKAPSFDCVFQWRLQQERKLATSIAVKSESKIMNEQQVLDFIQYYQRLTEHGLNTMPKYCDITFSLDRNRQIISATNKD